MFRECRKRLLEVGFKGGVFPHQMSPLELTSEMGSSILLFHAAVAAVEFYHGIVSEMEPNVE